MNIQEAKWDYYSFHYWNFWFYKQFSFTFFFYRNNRFIISLSFFSRNNKKNKNKGLPKANKKERFKKKEIVEEEVIKFTSIEIAIQLYPSIDPGYFLWLAVHGHHSICVYKRVLPRGQIKSNQPLDFFSSLFHFTSNSTFYFYFFSNFVSYFLKKIILFQFFFSLSTFVYKNDGIFIIFNLSLFLYELSILSIAKCLV